MHSDRPFYHFHPARNWMNDPNGLVYASGEYHLFYQYNPTGNSWGNMSWGHAVSKDLVTWQDLDVALLANQEYMIFSGSAVFDIQNTSGLGTRESPPLVAIYTAHRRKDGREVQCLAYSTDRGRTWQQYSQNPILDPGSRAFRDPKVFWYPASQCWVLCVAFAEARKIAFYRSANLRDWEWAGEFGPYGNVSGVWECPDLFPLEVENQPQQSRWVLVVSVNPGGRYGGSGVQYFVGEFDGRQFTSQEFATGGTSLLAQFRDGIPPHWKWTIDNAARPVASDAVDHSPDAAGRAGAVLLSPPFSVQCDYMQCLLAPATVPGKLAFFLHTGDGDHFVGSANAVNQFSWVDFSLEKWKRKLVRLKIVFEPAHGKTGQAPSAWGLQKVLLSDGPSRVRWVDAGADFYAPQTWNNLPDQAGRKVWLGWMNNWMYAERVPTSPWRGMFSLPRRLALREDQGSLFLIQKPIHALSSLRQSGQQWKNLSLAEMNRILQKVDLSITPAWEIILALQAPEGGAFSVKLDNCRGESLDCGYDPRSNTFYVDRSKAGGRQIHPRFAIRHEAHFANSVPLQSLHFFVDRCAVELFVNNGQLVFSELIFPRAPFERMQIGGGGATWRVSHCRIYPLKNIWQGKRAPMGE